jgi:uncharacterized protein YndB with AHSA1/START domain
MRSVRHATFTIERTYDAPPARVWHAWSDRDEKAAWFSGRRNGDVRGAVYRDIVPGERLVYAYDMYSDDTRISVSLGTVELAPVGDGTRLTYTEQGAYLDGLDTPEEREHGTNELFDALGRVLAGERATA